MKRQTYESFKVRPWSGTVTFDPKPGKNYEPGTLVYQRSGSTANYIDVLIGKNTEEKSIGTMELVEAVQEQAA
ncbi:hypothetical protein H6F86_21125 [Phormidium sp. FACHB-592]|uniref:Uncharacterized protein n=1 Tax=Stenomitos frigidus AS-A4 TaxID=2933935 RepID=A0ABV0KES6_9CYAN|nr:hypothetical protein [Phormidium sp. FACHB-592]MBD2076338.1 hypothetical protein [Phormidium sp. FACHB-592]